ncbi:MAG: cytochrome P450 [Oscillatoriales cyanobacterium]|nr:MAG: cytochrome P450 [Oscillatoriales cyanobacterium]
MDANAKKYGEIFTTRWGNLEPFVMIHNPQAIQEMLNSKALDAPGDINGILKPLLGEQSMIVISGEKHKRQRQLLMPPFHGERMRNYGQQICDITQDIASKWNVDRPFVARTAMQEITMRVILQVVFGLNEGPRLQQLSPLLASIIDMTGSPLRSSILFLPWLQQDWGHWSPWGRMKQQRQKIQELMDAEIADRKQQPDADRTDILSLMMAARDENGEPMSNEELRDELMTLLFAGHETTATALAWACYWIHSLPSVRQKLLQELMGHQLEPGTVVFGSIYLTHRREDLYPEPLQFKPERFLERQFSPYEYLPFGGGSRRCIGLALAQLEMKLVLATILRDFDLTLAEKGPVQAKRRGVTLGPAGGVRMALVGRRMRQQMPEAVASGV